MAEPEDLDRKLEQASEAVDRQIQDQDQPAQGSAKPNKDERKDGGKDGGKEPLEDSHDMPADGQVAEGGDGRGITAVQEGSKDQEG